MSSLPVRQDASQSRMNLPRWVGPLAAFGVVVAGVVAVVYGMGQTRSERPRRPLPEQVAVHQDPPIEATPPVDMKALRKKAWERIQVRLEETDRASAAEITKNLTQLIEFLSERKKRTDRFAESVLSLRGKWKFLKDKLPYTDSDAHLRFLSEKFESQVFSAEELRSVIQSIVASYVSNVQGYDNRLLVAVRADLADLTTDKGVSLVNGEMAFALQFKQLAENITPLVARDLQVAVTKEVVLFLTAEIAAQIVTRVAIAVISRLGITAGLLTAGTLGSWETFGISLVAAIILDIGFDWLMKVAGYEPERQVAEKVNETLDRVGSWIVDGIPEAHQYLIQLRETQKDDPDDNVRQKCKAAADKIEAGGCLGLRHELAKLNEMRANVRREALRKLILEGVDQ